MDLVKVMSNKDLGNNSRRILPNNQADNSRAKVHKKQLLTFVEVTIRSRIRPPLDTCSAGIGVRIEKRAVVSRHPLSFVPKI